MKRENKIYTIEDVKRDFNKAELILLTQEYKGVIAQYEYICKKHLISDKPLSLYPDEKVCYIDKTNKL